METNLIFRHLRAVQSQSYSHTHTWGNGFLSTLTSPLGSTIFHCNAYSHEPSELDMQMIYLTDLQAGLTQCDLFLWGHFQYLKPTYPPTCTHTISLLQTISRDCKALWCNEPQTYTYSSLNHMIKLNTSSFIPVDCQI